MCVHEGKIVYMGCSDGTEFGSHVVEQVYMSCNWKTIVCGLPDSDTLAKISHF